MSLWVRVPSFTLTEAIKQVLYLAALFKNHVRSWYLSHTCISLWFGSWPVGFKVIKRKMRAEWQATWGQQLHFFWKQDKNRCLHILNAKIKWKATFLGFRSKRKPDVPGLFSLVLQRRVVLSISRFLCHGLWLLPLVFKCTYGWRGSQQTFLQNFGNSL